MLPNIFPNPSSGGDDHHDMAKGVSDDSNYGADIYGPPPAQVELMPKLDRFDGNNGPIPSGGPNGDSAGYAQPLLPKDCDKEKETHGIEGNGFGRQESGKDVDSKPPTSEDSLDQDLNNGPDEDGVSRQESTDNADSTAPTTEHEDKPIDAIEDTILSAANGRNMDAVTLIAGVFALAIFL
jgi:hypothetical protein